MLNDKLDDTLNNNQDGLRSSSQTVLDLVKPEISGAAAELKQQALKHRKQQLSVGEHQK